jgi:hypothetical protein
MNRGFRALTRFTVIASKATQPSVFDLHMSVAEILSTVEPKFYDGLHSTLVPAEV